MPEVKWVAATDLYDHDGNYVSRTPVLTLDQIEAWLAESKIRIHNGNHMTGTVRNDTLNDLIAQVQAWRREKGE